MRSALGVDRMNALCPRRRSGQGRQPRPARWRAAPALTRALPWTTPNNHSLSGYSGATTPSGSTAIAKARLSANSVAPARSRVTFAVNEIGELGTRKNFFYHLSK